MPPLLHSKATVLAAVLALAVLAAAPARAITVPSGFVVENATPSAAWTVPVALQFFPDGRMLVAEKAGRVWTVTNGVRAATPLIDIRSEVLDANDRGLLGIAIHPDYATNHWIYLLYTVDPDSNGVETNNDAYGRLTRYTVSFTDPNAIQSGSRAILIGRNWREGIPSGSPSHTIGTLEFGADGTLLVSAGDGASFDEMDAGGLDPGLFGAQRTDPNEDIGAFRAQMLESMAGKILRLDPATGLGLPSNPFWVGNANNADKNRSRVWAYGLRNPFRFTIRPGSGQASPGAGDPGTIVVGDVGWTSFEDQNVATTGGRNFGWPCFEGPGQNLQYQQASPAHHGCGTIGTPTNPSPHTPPWATWHHGLPEFSVPPGIIGNAAVGGAFYGASDYPLAYHGAYFFGDFGQSWIQVATFDANDQLLGIQPFATGAEGPVDFAIHPSNGDLHYVSIESQEIRRLRYTGSGGNAPPVPIASGSPVVGPAPLTVNFSSSGSFDPEGDPFTRAWDFGDFSGSNAANPSHVYAQPGAFAAVLTVEDTAGGVARDTVNVFVTGGSNFPSTGVLDGFNRANGPVGGAWVDGVAGLEVSANQLRQTVASNSVVLSTPVPGPTQEAYLTVVTGSAAPEINLMLKVQGTSWSTGHIEVRFDAQSNQVVVSTYAPAQGWVQRAGPVATTIPGGTQIGARAYANGTVEVFRNGVLVLTADCSGWPFAANGGRVGLTLTGTSAARFDDFGGGDAVLDPNTPPVASVVSPADSSFFVADLALTLVGAGSDAQDADSLLAHRWEVDLHHNTHVHPISESADSTVLSFTPENHDDGTGVWFLARHLVTDTGGLRDTAIVRLFPETDLRVTSATTFPSMPGTTAPATWRVTIANAGRMPAPFSRWRLVSDAAVLAEGDTLVPALDSVVVTRVLAPTLAAGSRTVRATADTLRAVVETNESNNGLTRSITVVAGDGPDETPPVFTHGPSAAPAGVQAAIAWSTNEPATGVLRWGASPALGESLVRAPADTAHAALLVGLSLGTRYWFRVAATDTAGQITVSAPDSFETQSGPLSGGPTPTRLALSAPRPNPTRGAVQFALDLPQATLVRTGVYDLAGREVWRETPRALAAGRHVIAWDGLDDAGRPLPAALYLVRVQAGGVTFTRRLALLR